MPGIGLASEEIEKAQKVLAKAEKNCFVSNSLCATVHVGPRFKLAPAGVAK